MSYLKLLPTLPTITFTYISRTGRCQPDLRKILLWIMKHNVWCRIAADWARLIRNKVSVTSSEAHNNRTKKSVNFGLRNEFSNMTMNIRIIS